LNQLFTWFGCKKKVVDLVWNAWGPEVKLTAEPFAGTAVVTLNPPDWSNVKNRYLNDYNCYIANVFRSVLYDKDAVAYHAAHPRLEIDLHMIHDYLYAQGHCAGGLRDLLRTSITAHDAILAGWWVWGCNNWLGGLWGECSIKVDDLAKFNTDLNEFYGENKLVGTKRQKLNHRNQLTEQLVGTKRQKLNHINMCTEQLVGTGRNKLTHRNQLTERISDVPRLQHITDLVDKIYWGLRDCKILNGDFERLLTDSYLDSSCNGIFLDPPYPETGESGTYGSKNTEQDTFSRAIKWFLDKRNDKNKRIVFACQEHNLVSIDLPTDVRVIKWSRCGGYAQDKKEDRHTEVMLVSKHCNN